jgi:hypothetical protein
MRFFTDVCGSGFPRLDGLPAPERLEPIILTANVKARP